MWCIHQKTDILGLKLCVCGCKIKPTLLFRRSLSFRVSVSALAMTGTILTLLWMAFINSTSSGFRLGKKEKQRGQLGHSEKLFWNDKNDKIGQGITAFHSIWQYWETKQNWNVWKELKLIKNANAKDVINSKSWCSFEIPKLRKFCFRTTKHD